MNLPLPIRDAQAAEFATFLEAIQSPNGPYIHPRPISYKNKADRSSWKPDKDGLGGVADFRAYDTLTEFMFAPCYQNVRAGLFITTSSSAVGSAEERMYGHVWAAVVAKQSSRGKLLAIFDCDKTPFDLDGQLRCCRHLLTGRQRDLTQLAAKRYIHKVYLWEDTVNIANQGLCVEHTCRWLLQVANSGDSPVEEEDWRLEPFQLLHKV